MSSSPLPASGRGAGGERSGFPPRAERRPLPPQPPPRSGEGEQEAHVVGVRTRQLRGYNHGTSARGPPDANPEPVAARPRARRAGVRLPVRPRAGRARRCAAARATWPTPGPSTPSPASAPPAARRTSTPSATRPSKRRSTGPRNKPMDPAAFDRLLKQGHRLPPRAASCSSTTRPPAPTRPTGCRSASSPRRPGTPCSPAACSSGRPSHELAGFDDPEWLVLHAAGPPARPGRRRHQLGGRRRAQLRAQDAARRPARTTPARSRSRSSRC